jgi:hypothetical protein
MKYLILLFITSCSLQQADFIYQNKDFACGDACVHLEQMSCKQAEPYLFDQNCTSDAECSEGECLAGKCGIKCKDLCLKNSQTADPICWVKSQSCEEVADKCSF